MLVYGDRTRTADPRAEVAALLSRIAAVEGRPAGLERHAALVAALIACGELAQGLADAAFGRAGEDGPDSAADLALKATRALAEAVVRSWREGFAARPVDVSALRALDAVSLPATAALKTGEGFAFYALYPETYAEAAAALAPAPTTVVGLRSIGTSLGAVVAAALEADRFSAVRPTGPPFRRDVRIGDRLAAELLADPDARLAVVDEGPGLSGSSFGAALDWAEAQCAPRARLLAFPSHTGDLGPEASEAHRARWATLARPHVGFDALIAPRLSEWVADLSGPATGPLQDLSGGAWRALRYPSEAEWPAVNAAQERRKFLLRSDRGAFLLKFAGLGAVGDAKLARAERLAAAGFTPRPLGLRHGFLVEPWIEAHTSPALAEVRALLGPYLSLRATFPGPEDAGASLPALLDMAEVNVLEGLGAEAADRLAPWRRRMAELAPQVSRVDTDNRLHVHEWIADADGRLLKTDALDHAQAHDLVGRQDIAWDVAGAGVEFDLTEDALERLWRAVGGAGRTEPDFLRFHSLAYLAFQFGAHAMAVQAHAGWPEEAARLTATRDRYADRLRRMLSA